MISFIKKSLVRSLFLLWGEWFCFSNFKSFEGAFGQAPGLEAHGGSTFCASKWLDKLNQVKINNTVITLMKLSWNY